MQRLESMGGDLKEVSGTAPESQGQLRRQFIGALTQVRRLLQEELVQYLGANPLVAVDFIRALSLDALDPKHPPLSTIWKPTWDAQQRVQSWTFLPGILGEDLDGNDVNLTYKANEPHDNQCRFVAAAFGVWLYLFDAAEATYYYPFAGDNLLFGHVEQPFVLRPRRWYRDSLARYLEDYRLMVGEGSHGVAVRGARACVLPNTFADVRGGVALEDLILRNFAYASFPMRWPGRRKEGADPLQSAPFAYLALIFPAPLASQSRAMGAVANHLGGDMTDGTAGMVSGQLVAAAETFIAPVVSHIQYRVISDKQRQLTESLKGRDAEGSFLGSCDSFAMTLLHPIDKDVSPRHDGYARPIEKGLRDPFAFAGLHVVPPADIGAPDRLARRYYPERATLSVLLRTRLEASLAEFAQGNGEVASPSATDAVGAWVRALNEALEAEGSWRRLETFVAASVAGVEPNDADRGAVGKRGLEFFLVLQGGRASSSALWTENGLLRCAVERAFRRVLSRLAERKEAIRSWLVPGQQPFGKIGPWDAFEDAVLARKTHEVTCRIVGRVLVDLLISEGAGEATTGEPRLGDQNEAASTRYPAEAELSVLEKLLSTSEGKFLSEEMADLWRLPFWGSEALEVRPLASALVLSEDACLARPPLWSVDENIDEGRVLLAKRALESASVRRVLGTIARLGELIPFPGGDPLPKGARVVRVTPKDWDHTSLCWAGALSSMSGIGEGDGDWGTIPFNYSLMTTLSDPWLWHPRKVDPVLGNSLRYLYYIPIEQLNGRCSRALVALGPLVARAKFEEFAGASEPAEGLLCLLASAGSIALCTEWRIGDEAAEKTLLSWATNTKCLDELFEKAPTEGETRWLADVTLCGTEISTVRTVLAGCVSEERHNHGHARSFQGGPTQDRTVEFCFPQVVYPQARDPLVLASTGKGYRCQYRSDASSWQNACPEDVRDGLAKPLLPLLTAPPVARGLDSPISQSGIFNPEWGLRRHLVWPLKTPGREEAPQLGVLVLSSFVPTTVDPQGEALCPYLLGSDYQALLDGAVDYLEFSLQQERWKRDLERTAINFIHDSKNDWISVQHYLDKPRTARTFATEVKERLHADLLDFVGKLERTALCFGNADELCDYLRYRIASRLKDFQGETVFQDAFNVSDDHAFRAPEVEIGFKEAVARQLFPAYLPKSAFEVVLKELVLNALKYSARRDGRRTHVVKAAIRHSSDRLLIVLSNKANGLEARYHQPLRIGLDRVKARLERNLGEGCFIQPSASDFEYRPQGDRWLSFVLRLERLQYLHQLLQEQRRRPPTERPIPIAVMRPPSPGTRSEGLWSYHQVEDLLNAENPAG